MNTHTTAPSMDQLQRQVDKYREKLANAMSEFKSVTQENERLKAEVRSAKMDHKPLPRLGESQDELRAKNHQLEKELGQLRFNAKLKVKQLQKELSSIRGTAVQDTGLTADGLDPDVQQRVNELEDRLLQMTTRNDQAQQRICDLEHEMTLFEERSYAQIAAIQRQHEIQMDAFQMRMSRLSTVGSNGSNTHLDQNADLDQKSLQPIPPSGQTPDQNTESNIEPANHGQLASLITNLGLNFSAYNKRESLDLTDATAIVNAVSSYFADAHKTDPEALQDEMMLLQSARHSLRKRLSPTVSSAIITGDANSQSTHDEAALLREIEILKRQLSDKPGQGFFENAAQLVAELAKEQSRNTALAASLSDITQLLGACTDGTSSPLDIRATIDSLISYRDTASKEIDSLKSQLQQTTKTAHELGVKVSDRKAEIEALEHSNKHHEAASRSSTTTSAIEQRNFTLEEQLKDYRIQIATRQRELATTQEQLATKSSDLERVQKEADERIKKMKGLLLAANKNMTETKKLIAQREMEAENLKMQLETSRQAEKAHSERAETLQASLDEMGAISHDAQDASRAFAQELERQLTIAQADANDARRELQSYKVRAAAALQKTGTSALERRIVELEDAKRHLEREKADRDEKLGQTLKASARLQEELKEQLLVSEAHAKRLDRNETDARGLQMELESANRALAFEKQIHEEALKSKDANHAITMERIKAQHAIVVRDFQDRIQAEQAKLAEQQEKLKPRTEERINALNLEITLLRDQLTKAQSDLQAHEPTTQTPHATDPPRSTNIPPLHRRNSQTSQWSGSDAHAYQGPSYPPTPTVLHRAGSGSHMPSFREKEMQLQVSQLQDLLIENQCEIERLYNQEKLLKDELRKMDRMEKRQDLSVEYLKNVVLSFIESEVKEPLVPVISQILHLSPAETARIVKHISSSDESVPSFGFFG